MLRAIWDLRICPITFDFATYLAIVDCFRQLRTPDKGIEMTVRMDAFRTATPRDQFTHVDEKRWRVKSIVLDMCELLPSISTLIVTRDDRGPFNFPNEYAEGRIPYIVSRVTHYFKKGANPQVLSAPPQAVQTIPFQKPYVTLTLRTSRHLRERNVNLEEWHAFYEFLRGQGVNVVVVPDQEDLLGAREYEKFDWQVYAPASLDLRLRLALNEGASMNFCSSNGPAYIMFYSSAPVVQFDQMRGGIYDAEFWRKVNGFEAGGQFPWCRPDQRMIWKDSTLESLSDEWNALKLQ